MGRFPSLMGCFPTLLGRLPESHSGPKSLGKQSLKKRPIKRVSTRESFFVPKSVLGGARVVRTLDSRGFRHICSFRHFR